MSIDYFLKIIPSLGVLVTAITLYYQIWRANFSMNLDLVLKLDDKFNSPDFKEIRKKVSQTMLNSESEEKFDDAEDVFDFFETLGYFVKHNALNKKIVWHTFYHWVHLYWCWARIYL